MALRGGKILEKLPKTITDQISNNFVRKSYAFNNSKNLYYGNIKIVTYPLSDLSIDENCGHIFLSRIPLEVYFRENNILVKVDDNDIIYGYENLRKFIKNENSSIGQLWFKDSKDKYNDYIYEIEFSEELDLLLKGICVFGRNFIDIDNFNAWKRKEFKEVHS
jgi:hypothetical protein